MFDVIVIGAGPSGSIAAYALAKRGRKVLLLEKSKLPRYKSCSGVLIEKSLRFIERYLGCPVPTSVTCTPEQTRGMVFVDDAGKEYKFESRGCNIWRDKFDFWLTSLAEQCGATVQEQSAVTSVQEKDGTVCVTVNGKCEYAKYVVNCSGAAGIGTQTRNGVITYQTYNQGRIDLDPHRFYAYLQPELSGYDAWFNVKDGMLVLGVAATDARDIAKYYDNFIAYMVKTHALHIDALLRTDKWMICNIQPPFYIDYGMGGILKAGETAGFLNPMGEGISSALESGYAAALAIAENFDNKQNVMDAYRQSVSATADYMQRQWQFVGRISQKFAHMYSKA